MDPCSEAPRLGPIKILKRICCDNFLSSKLTVHKPKLMLDFSLAWLVLKLLYINICRYIQRCFLIFTMGKLAEKEDDVDYRYQPLLSTQMQYSR